MADLLKSQFETGLRKSFHCSFMQRQVHTKRFADQGSANKVATRNLPSTPQHNPYRGKEKFLCAFLVFVKFHSPPRSPVEVPDRTVYSKNRTPAATPCKNYRFARQNPIPKKSVRMSSPASSCRGVAQPGSAPALGAGGHRFKSCRPDQ
jgi:hypothetical protein